MPAVVEGLIGAAPVIQFLIRPPNSFHRIEERLVRDLVLFREQEADRLAGRWLLQPVQTRWRQLKMILRQQLSTLVAQGHVIVLEICAAPSGSARAHLEEVRDDLSGHSSTKISAMLPQVESFRSWMNGDARQEEVVVVSLLRTLLGR